MRYRDSIFGALLEPIDRRRFEAIVERHGGDAYVKTFDSWSHLVSLICAQLSGTQGLRELEAAWRANAHHHYHLGVRGLSRSTLSDANQRRAPAIFAEQFAALVELAGRSTAREGRELVRLIDSTPIPLGRVVDWAKWNGRIRGLKLHVVYDPKADIAERLSITPANVNDVTFGRDVPIAKGTTYVFDKAYCHYAWWTAINRAEAFFVTRRKANAHYRTVRCRPIGDARGDGFNVLGDREVVRSTKSNAKLPIKIRCIRIKRDNGSIIELLTNDMRRSAVKIAALYKARWQIELLFRWIKQNLNIRRFIGNSDNAVRLQILAAMIAHILLRIVAHANRMAMLPIRFAQLVGQCLFVRKLIQRIDKPPPVNLATVKNRPDLNQLAFSYA